MCFLRSDTIAPGPYVHAPLTKHMILPTKLGNWEAREMAADMAAPVHRDLRTLRGVSCLSICRDSMIEITFSKHNSTGANIVVDWTGDNLMFDGSILSVPFSRIIFPCCDSS